MIETIRNIFKVEDLRKRILFTLLMLVVYRLGSHIPVPNTNANVIQDAIESAGFFGLANAFAGNALSQFTIFATGIMPYIIASMIVQMCSIDVIPAFSRWAKEGEVGRRKLAQATRYFTVVLAIFSSMGLVRIFKNMSQNGAFLTDDSIWSYVLIAATLTAGTSFLMWIGEQITDRGIGNGISIIIFAGIVSGIPSGIAQLYEIWFVKESQIFLSLLKVVVLILAILAILVGVIYMQQGMRKIIVNYTKRVVGNKMYGGQATHIPFKINAAGVIPIIFASSIILIPGFLTYFWKGNSVVDWISNAMDISKLGLGTALYGLMIIGFTYFYTFIQLNPAQLADQMKKNGGFIPGIRPGKNTLTYLTRILNRLTFAGSLFLVLIALMPIAVSMLFGLPRGVVLGGTSLLIVIGVALETMKTVESQLIKRHYKGFMHK